MIDLVDTLDSLEVDPREYVCPRDHLLHWGPAAGADCPLR